MGPHRDLHNRECIMLRMAPSYVNVAKVLSKHTTTEQRKTLLSRFAASTEAVEDEEFIKPDFFVLQIQTPALHAQAALG